MREEQVVEKDDASCKVASIGLDSGLDALVHYTSCEDAQDIAERQAFGIKVGKFTSLTSRTGQKVF